MSLLNAAALFERYENKIASSQSDGHIDQQDKFEHAFVNIERRDFLRCISLKRNVYVGAHKSEVYLLTEPPQVSTHYHIVETALCTYTIVPFHSSAICPALISPSVETVLLASCRRCRIFLNVAMLAIQFDICHFRDKIESRVSRL